MADPSSTELPARPFGRTHIGAPTGSEAAAFDREAIDRVGVPQYTLMENAGRSAAQIVQRLHPDGRVVGVVGAGNNGGDALVLLRTLSAWGRTVRALIVADRVDEGLRHGWDLPTVLDTDLAGDEAYDAILAGAGVVVDGILGTGIRGAPRERQARAIEAVNRSEAPVFALDIPSGVDAATGAAAGASIRAQETVAFGWPKLGSLVPPGRSQAGRLIAVEIGFPPAGPPFGAAVITTGWAHARRPRRESETHKYAVGTLLLVAGRAGMGGAAVMAARAAQRSGIGLLRVASAAENREILQTTAPEAIFVDLADPAAVHAALERSATVAAGPGLGTDEEAGKTLSFVLAESGGKPTALDADALTLAAAGRTPRLEDLARDRPLVLTPHAGEFERITSHGRDAIAADRVGVARAAAATLGATVLLKGLPSVVAAPAGQVRVDVMGTSDLATGGMGDVLTGVVGSFLAQGAPPAEAAALGLYYSGRAAVLAGRGPGLIPDDVVDRLSQALLEEGDGVTDLDLPFVVFDQDPPR